MAVRTKLACCSETGLCICLPVWTNSLKISENMYASKNDYLVQKVQLISYRALGYGYWSTVGTWASQLVYGYSWDECIDSTPNPKEYKGDTHIRNTIDNGEAHFRTALLDTLVEHVVETFPRFVYFDPDISVNVANLRTILLEYAQQESAKFVTGARPLSELDAYFDEIERLGAKEYVKYYEDYYKALKSK